MMRTLVMFSLSCDGLSAESCRRQCGGVRALDAILDRQHHLVFHDEVRRLPEGVADDAVAQAWCAFATATHDQPSGMFVDGLEDETPRTVGAATGPGCGGNIACRDQDHGAVRLKYGYFHPPHTVELVLGSHPNHIADSALLPLRDDLPGVPHLATEEVFELRVAVETGAILSDLYDPRPDLRCGSVDGDGVRSIAAGIRNQFVAGP